MAKPKLGSGGRFKALKGKLASKGAKNPGALAAFIGRKKYGAKKFASLSAHGKKSRKATYEGSAMDKKVDKLHHVKEGSKDDKELDAKMKLKMAMKRLRG